MLPEISEIKRIRTSLNITQKKLSEKVHISQSYLTKIETKKANAPYSLVKKLFDYLNSFNNEEKKEKIITAVEIMNKDIKCSSKNNTLKYVISKLNEFNISQLPVIENDIVIGSINGKKIAELISKEKQDIKYIKVKNVMNPPFPVLSQNTNIKIIANLLLNNDAVVLTNDGKLNGIITKQDLNKLII